MKLRQFFILLKAKLLLRLGGEIYYINGPETLPPPIPKELEAEVFARLAENDPQAKIMLITHNLRLVVYIAKKFESTGLNVEDLISIGTIGLIKAVGTFCPDKNIKLATYASRCIENEILMFLRKSSNRRQELSIDEPLNTDWDGNELLVSDVVGCEAETVFRGVEDEGERDLVALAVQGLPERERQIIELCFGLFGCKEHTQKEVADMIGISQSYISRLEKRILSRLRADIETIGGV